jgi:hypothetical protein
MTHPNRSCIVFLLAGVLGTTAGTAWADDPPAGAPAAAPAAAEPPAAPMAGEHRFTGDKQSFYISGGVSDSPFFSIGTTLPNGLTFAVGLDVKYKGNGLPVAGATAPSTDKFAFTGLLYGAYYFYNKFPVGIAAEAAVIAPLSPTAFQVTTIQPGIGFYYAPFPAPIVLGTGLDVQINIFKDSNIKPTISTVTPGVRIVYVF